MSGADEIFAAVAESLSTTTISKFEKVVPLMDATHSIVSNAPL